MEMVLSRAFYLRRETAAQLGTVMAGVLILVMSQVVTVMYQEAPAQDEPISLSIEAPAVAPESVVEQVQEMPPLPRPMPDQPAPVVQQPVAEVAQEVAPVAPAPVVQEAVQAPRAVEPQAQPKGNADAENRFAQDVRSRIERKKIYPDTARDLGMSGEVEVLYELDRAGSLLRAEIVSSSGSKLLDQAALRAVKSAGYKAFPEDAWLGAGSKVFKTKLVFSINQ